MHTDREVGKETREKIFLSAIDGKNSDGIISTMIELLTK
jgi:hypothetical protein